MPRQARSRWSRATRPSSTRSWAATPAAECRKLAPDRDIVTCQRRLLWLFAAPKALAVTARQRLWRGPSCHPITCHSASFLHAGLLGHPLHLEQHRGAYRAHTDALRAGICDACGANTAWHRRRPRGARSGGRVLDDGDASDRCGSVRCRTAPPDLLAATHAAPNPNPNPNPNPGLCAVLFNHRERAACLSNDA